MATEHTPGPWHHTLTSGSWIDAGKVLVGEVIGSNDEHRKVPAVYPDYATMMANGRLMAAAPDLLEACRVAAVHLRDGGDDLQRTLIHARLVDAIAKATGKDGAS